MYHAWARFKQMLNSFPYHMQNNEVLAHTFFEALVYNACSLLDSALRGHDLSITSEALFNLLDKLLEGNQGYERDTSRTTTQKTAGILDIDQATTLNAKIDTMQHSRTV